MYPNNAQAKDAFLQIIRRDPREIGINKTRWTLYDILSVCEWLRTKSISGLHKILYRVGISYKRGREYILSPDPDYDEKAVFLSQLLEDVRNSEGKLVLLYLDELSYYRQPTLSLAYEEQGHHQPLAFRSVKWDVLSRVAAMLDVTSGKVIFHSGSKVGIAELVELYCKVREIYPDAERIYVAQDSWPIHFHPDVLVALEPQECKWPMRKLKSWPDDPKASAVRKWGDLNLPIQIVPLPTYAPWMNYTEKLWRWLKQDVLHMHKLADKLEELRALVDDFLTQFSDHSDELLRYTGLLTPD